MILSALDRAVVEAPKMLNLITSLPCLNAWNVINF